MTAPLRPSQEPYPEHALHAYLAQTAARLPNKTAVIDGARSMTFKELEEASSRFARALQSMGVAKGDRVALLTFNCLEFVIAFHGISKAGGVVTTLNPSYREREVIHQLHDCEAKALIVQSQLYTTAKTTLDAGVKVDHVIAIGESPESGIATFQELLEGHPPDYDPAPIDARNDLAALPYSSGTTGLPKGVMLSHFNLVSNLVQFMNVGGESAPKEEDVFLTFLPLYHIYGMNMLMNAPIALGATIVLMPRFDMEETLRLIEKHKVTLLYIVPPVVLAFINHPAVAKADLSSVRFALSGAAPLSAEMQAAFKERTGIPCNKGYGLTETSPLTNGDYLEHDLQRPGSIGPVVSDTEEMIVDIETGANQLGPGETGELLIRGPQVMKGYWNDPQATSEALRDGWLYTRDIAYMDKDGWVYIVDRKKEMIKFKGFQIAPAELEGVLLDHPAVADAAVIGKPDTEAGEVPKAFVVLKSQATTAEIIDFAGSQLANYKRIAEVEFVDQIPKSPSGKILRRILIEQERAKAT